MSTVSTLANARHCSSVARRSGEVLRHERRTRRECHVSRRPAPVHPNRRARRRRGGRHGARRRTDGPGFTHENARSALGPGSRLSRQHLHAPARRQASLAGARAHLAPERIAHAARGGRGHGRGQRVLRGPQRSARGGQCTGRLAPRRRGGAHHLRRLLGDDARGRGLPHGHRFRQSGGAASPDLAAARVPHPDRSPLRLRPCLPRRGDDDRRSRDARRVPEAHQRANGHDCRDLGGGAPGGVRSADAEEAGARARCRRDAASRAHRGGQEGRRAGPGRSRIGHSADREPDEVLQAGRRSGGPERRQGDSRSSVNRRPRRTPRSRSRRPRSMPSPTPTSAAA